MMDRCPDDDHEWRDDGPDRWRCMLCGSELGVDRGTELRSFRERLRSAPAEYLKVWSDAIIRAIPGERPREREHQREVMRERIELAMRIGVDLAGRGVDPSVPIGECTRPGHPEVCEADPKVGCVRWRLAP